MNSSEVRGFLTGLILGDGAIDKGVKKRAFRIKSINEDFIDYIYNSLDQATEFSMNVVNHSASVRDNISRKPYQELTIRSHPYFAKKYHHFYDDNRKRRVTTEALNWLTPRGIANWYMSGGYIVRVGKNSGQIKNRRVELATDRYPIIEVEKMKKYFEQKHGYEVKLIKRKEGVYRLRFSLLSAQDLFIMIEPYITPSMKYKIDLCYTYQPKWMCDEYYRIMEKLHSANALAGNTEGKDIV